MIPAQYFSVSFYPNPPFSVNNGKSHLYPGRSMSVNVQSMFTQWSNVLCKCAVQNVRGLGKVSVQIQQGLTKSSFLGFQEGLRREEGDRPDTGIVSPCGSATEVKKGIPGWRSKSRGPEHAQGTVLD